MTSSDKFWMGIWAMAALVSIVFLNVVGASIIASNKNAVQMAELGYTQIRMTQTTPYGEPLWVKDSNATN